jgi:hypothetical protein
VQLIQIDVVGAQNVQTLLEVALKSFIIPRIALAGQKYADPVTFEHGSDHFLARAVAARGIPVIDAFSESRLKQSVGGTKALFHECCT